MLQNGQTTSHERREKYREEFTVATDQMGPSETVWASFSDSLPALVATNLQ